MALVNLSNTLRRPRPFISATSVGSTSIRRVLTRAEQPNQPNPFDGPAQSAGPTVSEENRLELLEASVKGGRKAIAKAKRTIPIKGQIQPKDENANSNMSEWKEGALFPEGWEQMNLGQKITELYLGRRGVLFWANKAAYASVFVLLGAWVIFRFVGPNLGLYTLQGDFAPPPL